jgi:hypothetical protein
MRAHWSTAPIKSWRHGVGASVELEEGVDGGRGTDPATGKPTLAWHFDQHALDGPSRHRRLVRPADQPGPLTVICLALLIFCLVERQLHRAIAPAERLDGLWALMCGTPA